jgi:hypothetical protein
LPFDGAVPVVTLPSRRLAILVAVVFCNYLAQIPYSLHLYGLSADRRGVVLLGATLVWFVAGVGLLMRGRAVGYWLLVSFLAVEFVFYFRNEILLIPGGYGMPYHLTHIRDPLLYVVFLIGDVNFLAAGYFLWYLLSNGRHLIAQRARQ